MKKIIVTNFQLKWLNKPQNYNFCTKVEVEIIDHGVKKTVLKEVENTECIRTNVTFKTWHIMFGLPCSLNFTHNLSLIPKPLSQWYVSQSLYRVPVNSPFKYYKLATK